MRFAVILIGAITEGIGSDNKRHPADVRSFCLSSEVLCRSNCLAVLQQEHACPLFNTVVWLAFKNHDEYWVKQETFRKMEQRKAQAPLGLSISLCPYHTSLCFYSAPSYLPSNFSVALSYSRVLWFLLCLGVFCEYRMAAGQPSHLTLMCADTCGQCKLSNTQSRWKKEHFIWSCRFSITCPCLVKPVFFKKWFLKSSRQPQSRGLWQFLLGQSRWFKYSCWA